VVAPFLAEEVLDGRGMDVCIEREREREREREYIGMLLSLYDNTITKDSTEHGVYESGFC
jgi:hypothetical protein